MYLLKVIPIANKLPEKYFSYFSMTKIKIGTLVEIRIKNRKVFGIVIDTKSVKSEKINLKKENFSLKKIERIMKEDFIDEKLIEALNLSNFLLNIKESEVLEIFLNDNIFENILSLDKSIFNFDKKINKTENLNNKKNKNIAIIGEQKERIEKYLIYIKEEIKNKKSCTIFSPTINDLENILNLIKLEYIKTEDVEIKEIIDNTIIFHSEQKKKDTDNNLEKLKQNTPKLFLSTPSVFPFLLNKVFNFGAVIIDRENSFNYFSHQAKKGIDTRELIKSISNYLDINIIFGGEILSLKTFKEIENKKIKLIDLKKDNLKNKKILIFDLSKEKEKINLKHNPVYFKKEVMEKLEEYKKKREGKIFFYTKRKGIAGEIICKDCNHILKCETCDKPYILFKENKNNQREYICTICKDKKELNKKENLSCDNCGSWRVETLGIGTEGIEENLKENGFKVFVVDSKNTNTKTKVKKEIENWQKENLSILIGTDLALNNINQDTKIDFAGIISIDSLFSIPEINIDEKIMNLIIDFKEKCKTKSKLFIETRLKEADIWKYVEENNYLDFLKTELENRKIFNMPPFSNIIKFRLNLNQIKYKNNIEDILNRIKEEENVNLKNIVWKKESKTGEYIGIIFIDEKYWIKTNEEGIIYPTNFTKKIHTLLSDFNLEINPQSVYTK